MAADSSGERQTLAATATATSKAEYQILKIRTKNTESLENNFQVIDSVKRKENKLG